MKINDATIDALRPDPVEVDADWSHKTLRRILAAEPARKGRSRLGRRIAMVALGVTATSGLGLGVAAATTGFSLDSFTDAFSYWSNTPYEGHPGVDPAKAMRVASAPGPNDSVFSVLSTGGNYGCWTAILESAPSAEQPQPSSFTDVTDNFCSQASKVSTDFGGVSVTYGAEVAGYTVGAGNAVRAKLTTADGAEYPALLVDGLFWGWFPKNAEPTLVAYAKDGTVVDRIGL